jgi:hypothetical protein
VLVQKSVTTITNAAGRLSGLDARESCRDAQGATSKKLAFGLPAALTLACAFPLDNAAAGASSSRKVLAAHDKKTSLRTKKKPLARLGMQK